ncbi:MAG: PolC-type DNA polymerase III [Candidatus Improbicoccus pseudotrichonymphae]|uniref:DNA polymerase III PolC-type n=1 Tax=Candidatus Improbicoccus pseudotrichonymphae TaxID=3033792 RepID=A0AA48L166_9FIRM|nr:MAG: PolC-type DNA polymerase III [Candidatus Improbicoccus pseudotrichonymphae]
MVKFNSFFSKYLKKTYDNLEECLIASIKVEKSSRTLNLKLHSYEKINENEIKDIENDIKKVLDLSLVTVDVSSKEETKTKSESKTKEPILRVVANDKEVVFGNVISENFLYARDVEKEGRIVVAGKIFEVSVRAIKNFVVCVVRITDYIDSISIKMYKNNGNARSFGLFSKLEKNKVIIVKGTASYDDFEKELIITPTDINLISEDENEDNCDVKRIELHTHTSMSAMDGISNVKEIINRAYKWGHKAIAITDHGVVQAFPDAMNTVNSIKKKYGRVDFKVIYGVENYFVNDIEDLNKDAQSIKIDSNYVCFDVETTGFSAQNDQIIEIGAVCISNIKDHISGKINIFESEEKTIKFQSFVKNEIPLPMKITELTGITESMLADAPSEEETIRKFVDFCGKDAILVAHNASFDDAFLNAALKKYNIKFEHKIIDTIPFCKSQIDIIKNYKLGTVAKFFNLPEFKAHRACDDAKILAFIFLKLIQNANVSNLGYDKKLSDLFKKIDIKKEFAFHQTILVKNKIGLKNLYKLISLSHLNYFYKKPRIPKSELISHREGLLIGSACESGELFKAVVNGQPMEKLKEIAKFYDYLEIQPIGNNEFMIRENLISGGKEQLQEFNKKIVELGEILNIPVVATGDVHFLDPQDYKFRWALMLAQGYKDGMNQAPLFFRTTQEMIDEFLYLGEEKAYEVVVTNTQKIQNMIENIDPIPSGVYPPEIPGAREELIKVVTENSKEKYGENLPEIISKRLDKELESITKHGYSVLYIVAKKLVENSEKNGYLVGSRGSVGSSFVANISGISEVNPLKPHYICLKCKKSEFFTDGSYLSGFDLPKKKCPECGSDYSRDGHDIPFETFLGFDGEKTPDIDLNFSGEYQSKAHKYTEEIFGKTNVFRAGTIATIAEKTSKGFIRKVIEENNVNISSSEQRRLILGCTGIKRTTGQHPGGMIIVPSNMEIYDFCPVQKPANDQMSESITTHFDFHSIHDTICKLDELGHDVPTTYKYLEELTGIPVNQVDMSDPKVMSLFTSTKAIGVTPEEIDSKVATFSLPEMGTSFVRQMLIESKPKTFADLVQISGLSHGTDVWNGNARELIKNKTCDISQVIGTRDNIMVYLISKGIDKKTAFKITEIVRKGQAMSKFTKEDIKNLKDHNVPDWYINSCLKIKYMFPKAHAVAYVIATLRFAWYKVYRPLEYYVAFLSAHGEDVDGQLVMKGKDEIVRRLVSIEKKGKEASIKERASISTLQILSEIYARKIEFLPVDIYKSHAKKFLVEDNKIRLPLVSFSGLGDAVAQSIQKEREHGKFISMDDLRQRTGINKTITELLKTSRMLNLQESNQISFF